jgi:hypothetical protein
MEFTRVLQYQFPLLRGYDVRAAQQALAALAVAPPCGPADGVFGAQTKTTVRAFQTGWNAHATAAAARVPTDGRIDQATWTALFDAARTAGATAPHATGAAGTLPADIAKDVPLTRAQMGRLKAWMTQNFKDQIDPVIAGTPVDFDLVCAIAAKESAIYWIEFIDRMKPADLLPLCVFDASGDFPGTQRSAFPMNAAALRQAPGYGDAITDMLIAESNKMRHVLRGFGPATYLYKGYGLFQYDLQNIVDDRPFFEQKLWYTFDHCIDRMMREMREKLNRNDNDLTAAVVAYNGSGVRAQRYAESVMILRDWSSAVA